MTTLELILRVLMFALPGVAVSFAIKYINTTSKKELLIVDSSATTKLRMNIIYQIAGYAGITIMLIFWITLIYYGENYIYTIVLIIRLVKALKR